LEIESKNVPKQEKFQINQLKSKRNFEKKTMKKGIISQIMKGINFEN
jgi:hypothetical protein